MLAPPADWRTYVSVGHGVVPPKEAGGDVVGDDHVHAVVLVTHQDADDPRDAEDPTEPLVPPHPAGRVWEQQENQEESASTLLKAVYGTPGGTDVAGPGF